MKKLIGTLAIALSIPFSGVTSQDVIPGVKSLEENFEGHFEVTCANDSTGVISFEETNICVFSKANNKNRCDTEDNWTIEAAAEYVCTNK